MKLQSGFWQRISIKRIWASLIDIFSSKTKLNQQQNEGGALSEANSPPKERVEAIYTEGQSSSSLPLRSNTKKSSDKQGVLGCLFFSCFPYLGRSSDPKEVAAMLGMSVECEDATTTNKKPTNKL